MITHTPLTLQMLYRYAALAARQSEWHLAAYYVRLIRAMEA